jgi:rare lipoprotein A
MRRGGGALALALLMAAACTHSGPRPGGVGTDERAGPPLRPEPQRQVELGLASYYARSLQGRRTASGARYDGRAMTCAHRTHPFGTLLRVTDVESGKSVTVKVTDRGPFAQGRVIDLSWAAARVLGILEQGVARVKVEPAPP